MGVEFKGIKAKEGGCIYAGEAITNSMDFALLSTKQREKLAVAYATYNKVLDEIEKNAEGVAETINGLSDLLNKAKAFAKNYKGGKADAAKAKAYQEQLAKYQKNLSDNKAVPADLKTLLTSTQTAAKEAWDFYKTGAVCTATGNSGSKNSFFSINLADCAAFEESIKAEADAAEKANQTLSCNCAELATDCDEITRIMASIKSANGSSDKSYEMSKNIALVDYENNGDSFLTGIEIGKNCFHVKIDIKFNTGTARLDLTKFKINKESSSIEINDFQNQEAVIITFLPKSKGTFNDLINYLGFGGGIASFEGEIDSKLLKSIFPNIDSELSIEILPYVNKYLNEFGLKSCEARTMFFTQIAEETDNLGLLEEGASDWPSSSSNYKGRGLFQLTGQRNYRNFTSYCVKLGDEVDFVTYPDRINEPKYAVLSAFWYWNVNNCQKYSRALTESNMLKIAKITNCGSINSNCAENDKAEPCSTCKPNGWERRKLEFNRLKTSFPCK